MSETAPDKMKVADLRAALQERGLDTKGTKPVLVTRLQEALDAEKPEKPEGEEAAPAAAAENGDKADEAEPMEQEESKEEKEKEAETKEEKSEQKSEEKPEEQKGTKRKLVEEPYEIKEVEPEIDDDLLCLDWYNCDLNLKIGDCYMTAMPYIRDAWGYCYAGVRATHGFKSGKVWYEVKYVDNMDAKVDKDTTTFDLRVGWSTNDSSLMLGESETSWCYSGCEGKMAHNSKFEEYGEKFTKNDVIGAYLDFGEEEISMTFTKNGEDQGDAFQIPRSEFPADTCLFPHILTRNIKFQVNFGVDKEKADEENWKDKLEGDHVKVGKATDMARGTPRIKTREECEMIMVVGLPGAGKTTWVEKHVKENPDKNYNVISTTEIFKKMTVNGEPRKKTHQGKWDLVVQKATRSLQEMIRTASTRRRNIIIDQTNVFPSARMRKARPFQGFERRCVVVVPSDEDYKARVKNQEEAGCKDIPDDAIMEMKANFLLPEEDDPSFKEIKFVELEREEAKAVVDLYNKVAKEKGFGKKHEENRNKNFKKPKLMRGGHRGNFRGNRGFNPRGMMRGGRGNMHMGPSPWAKNNGNNAWGGNWNQGNMGGRMGMGNMGMGGMGMGNMGMGGMGGMGNMGGMGMNMGMGGMGGMSNMGMGGGMGNMGMGGGMGNMGGMGMSNMGMGGMGNMGMGGMGMGGGMGGGMGMRRQGGFGGGFGGGNQFQKKPQWRGGRGGRR